MPSISLMNKQRRKMMIFNTGTEVWVLLYPAGKTSDNLPRKGLVVSSETLEGYSLFSVLHGHRYTEYKVLIETEYGGLPSYWFIPEERVFQTYEQAFECWVPKTSCDIKAEACEVLNDFLNSESVGTRCEVKSTTDFSIKMEGERFEINMPIKGYLNQRQTAEIQRKIMNLAESVATILNWS